MKKLIAALCFIALAAPGAYAQEKSKSAETKAPPPAAEKKAEKAPSEAQKKQQERMTNCNKQAGDKKLAGDQRKSFMSSCLKGEEGGGASDKQKAQQQKMTDCNKQAGDKKLAGEERKKFMSTCLKG